MKKKLFALLLAAAMLLCACQETPETAAVISKNDGAFDANAAETAVASDESTESVHYEKSASTTDGYVDFALSIDGSVPTSGLPIVEVTPHTLTSADAQRVAEAVFGEADFYVYDVAEYDEDYEKCLTKSEIQTLISRWAPYTDADAFEQLYCYRSSGDYGYSTETIRGGIEELNALYETAPENYDFDSCDWSFHTGEDGVTEEITAYVNGSDGVRYRLSFSTRDAQDYKLNYVNIYKSPAYSRGGIEEQLFFAEHCAGSNLTGDQLQVLQEFKERAQTILDSCGLGDWSVDACVINDVSTIFEERYTISVTAVPVFDDTAAVRRTQLDNLKSDSTYASNYYLTDAQFLFAADGTLMSFSLQSPVDVQQAVNENTAVLDMDELLKLAADHLSLSDADTYRFGEETRASMAEEYGEEVGCRVDITRMAYGLVRVKVPDTDESYYYVPGLTLYGIVNYYGEESGEGLGYSQYDYWCATASADGTYPLLTLNAVDGSVIDAET